MYLVAPSISASASVASSCETATLLQSSSLTADSPEDSDLPLVDIVIIDEPGRESFDWVLRELCAFPRERGRAAKVTSHKVD